MASASPSPTFLAVLALLGTTACGPQIRLSDDIDVEWDREVTQAYDDTLHGPYVAGASFQIYAYDITEGNALDDWTITSRDPNILEVSNIEVIRDKLDPEDQDSAKTDILVATIETTGPGVGTIEIRRPGGRVVREAELSVMEPDRVELIAAGPLFISDRADAPNLADTTPQIVAGGLATFLVEWWAGDQRLYGSGSLALTSEYPDIINLRTNTEHLDEVREWAQFEFEASEGPAVASVDFLANGVPAATIDFAIVGPDEVDHIELFGSTNGLLGSGRQLLAVLAQAFDIDGETIWGVAFDWDIDGRVEPEEGDIFRYWYDASVQSILGAEYGGARTEVIISGEHGFVESSNEDPVIGGPCLCSTTQDPPGGYALGFLTLLALTGVRRRRG